MVASDNFNRPDGPLGTNWVEPAASMGNMVITNNMVSVDPENAHCEAFWSANSFNDDQYSQAILTSIGAWTGVIARADTNQDMFYLGFVFGANDYRIYGRYEGAYYKLAAGTNVTWQVGDTLRMEVSGSVNPATISLYQNGTPVLMWRSTAPAQVFTGGSPGLGIYSPAGDHLTIGSWEGGNLDPDTNAPTVPGNLAASAASMSEIDLSWTTSTDDVEVVGYLVERSQGAGSTNFTLIATPTGTNFNDTGTATGYNDTPLLPGTTYNYLVLATDAHGNLSGSNEVTATTPFPAPPTISVIPDQTTLMGISAGPFPFYISDPGVDPSLLIATATSSNTNLVPDESLYIFNPNGTTQSLTITPAAGQIGTSTITITASNGVNSTNTSFLLTVNPPGNGTDVFANPSNIVISSASVATPYPSTINVTGESGTITNLSVTLHGMSHSYPANVNALLVAPDGQTVVLMSDTVGNFPMTNITFSLSDQAYYPLPVDSPMADGTFQPTDTDAAPDHTNLGVFDGLSPNGTWSLYIFDDGIDHGGQISGGWSLAITTVSPPTIGGLTNQSTPVNTPTAAIPFEIDDAQTPASNLVLTATSSDPTVVAVGGMAFTKSDNTFTNQTITLTPQPNTIGVTTISVIVTDRDGMSATNSFLMTVNPGQLTVTGITAANKPYDGTTIATLNVSATSLTGQGLGGSDVTLNTSGASGMFIDANSGTNKTVQIAGLFLNGTDAGNYVLAQPATTANITALGVAVGSGISANDRAYDGTVAATITSNNVVLVGVLPGDTAFVSVSTNGYVANFAGANVGTNIAVTVGGLSLMGSAAGNYTFSQPAGLTANITALGVTVGSGISADTKTYDGTVAATITSNNVVLAGVLPGDTAFVSVSTNGYVANFAGANVGTNIAVTVGGLSLMGSAAGNYTFSQPAGLTANITALGVTVGSGISADTKTYDGTVAATITSNNVVLAGVLPGDTAFVSVSTNGYVANFAGANVGTNIAVTVGGLSLMGSAAGNYTFSQPAGLTANITALGVTVGSGISADTKTYDGTVAATITSNNVVLAGVLPGDTAFVSVSTNGYVANFAGANVGTNIAVTVGGLSLMGSAAGNYTFSQPAGLTANITALGVTVGSGISADTKTYDGTVAATITSNNVVLAGVLPGDTAFVSVSTNGYVANFAGANVGTNIAVTVDGLSLTGSAAGNYTFSQPAGLTANITFATLTVSADNRSKTYGLPNPTLTVTYSGFVNNEGTNVLAGAPDLSTSATNNSPPGPYDITVGAGTLSATNYTFNLVNGTLTVVALPELSGVLLGGSQLVLTWPTIANQTYELESTTNLITAAWTPVGGSVAGTGSLVIVTNSLAVSPQLFFRLTISP